LSIRAAEERANGPDFFPTDYPALSGLCTALRAGESHVRDLRTYAVCRTPQRGDGWQDQGAAGTIRTRYSGSVNFPAVEQELVTLLRNPQR
jgi:hypothetical protein